MSDSPIESTKELHESKERKPEMTPLSQAIDALEHFAYRAGEDNRLDADPDQIAARARLESLIQQERMEGRAEGYGAAASDAIKLGYVEATAALPKEPKTIDLTKALVDSLNGEGTFEKHRGSPRGEADEELKEAMNEMRNAHQAYFSWTSTTSPPDWNEEIRPLEERVQTAWAAIESLFSRMREERNEALAEVERLHALSLRL